MLLKFTVASPHRKLFRHSNRYSLEEYHNKFLPKIVEVQACILAYHSHHLLFCLAKQHNNNSRRHKPLQKRSSCSWHCCRNQESTIVAHHLVFCPRDQDSSLHRNWLTHRLSHSSPQGHLAVLLPLT